MEGVLARLAARGWGCGDGTDTRVTVWGRLRGSGWAFCGISDAGFAGD